MGVAVIAPPCPNLSWRQSFLAHIHTTYAHYMCTPHMHTTCAHHICTPHMHTTCAHHICTPHVHTTPYLPHAATPTFLPATRCHPHLPTCHSLRSISRQRRWCWVSYSLMASSDANSRMPATTATRGTTRGCLWCPLPFAPCAPFRPIPHTAHSAAPLNPHPNASDHRHIVRNEVFPEKDREPQRSTTSHKCFGPKRPATHSMLCHTGMWRDRCV